MTDVGELLSSYPWIALLLQCLLAAAVGLVVHAVAERLVRRFGRRYPTVLRITDYTHRTTRVLVPLLLVHLALTDAPVPAGVLAGLRQLLSIIVIVLVTLLAIRVIAALADATAARHPTNIADNLQARSVQTQVRVLARITMVLIGLLGLGSMLMTFPNVRQIGASLLASAGVAGIVAGLAARPVLGNLIAGLQIALTQPIRVDDVLIVENEWGRVEEITGTYVVIRIWDDRRLVVPLEYFIQNPFQNWTRHTSDLIGSVFLWVDYRMPVQPLRDALRGILEQAQEWDGRVCVLQVTDFSDKAMQLRALVSTRDAGLGWDLRCKVREQLIAFMQEHYPEWLPQVRATVDRPVRTGALSPEAGGWPEVPDEGTQAPSP